MRESKKNHASLSSHEIRLLRLLSKAKGQTLSHRSEDVGYMLKVGSRDHTFAANLVARLEKLGSICIKSDMMSLTVQGKLMLNAALCRQAGKGLAQSETIELKKISVDGEQHVVSTNVDESPLNRLHRKSRRDGSGYISDSEFLAGERIRSEFHRAHLEPKISASWSMTAGQAGKRVNSSGTDISDFAIDAKTRFYRALDTIGPELAGVVVDVCCFLKGLEAVERERRWPPRSAKLMLKTALAALARYYGLVHEDKRRSGKLQKWGAKDFRPSI